MTTFHRVLDVARADRALATVALLPGIVVEEASPSGSATALAGIVERCRASGSRGVRQLSSRGLTGDLASRPGRRVRLWLASAADEPLGMASLHESGTTEPGRFSVGWLLVVPERRRSGLGLALVATVVAAAHARRAREIHVEVHPAWMEAEAFWGRVAHLVASAPCP